MTGDLFTWRPASPVPEVPDGPLAGKAVVIRPDLAVREWLTDAGSRALAGFHAVSDATVITRLKRAGALLAGSARMAELGFGIHGDTMPRILATRQAHIGLMTDTLGEARLAACAAGCFAFKPSYGLISRCGLIGLAPSMECIAVLACDPADLGSAAAVMAGWDGEDFSMSREPLPDLACPQDFAHTPIRIGVLRECREQLGPAEAASFAAALETLAAAGFEMREVSLPGFELFPVVHQIVAAVEASSAAGKYDGVRYGFRADTSGNWNEMYLKSRAEAFGARLKALLFQGAYFQFQNYRAFENAAILRGRLVREIEALLGQADLLALPARHRDADPVLAETVPETYAAFGLTLPANLAGLPAVQVPALNRHGGTDLGLQLLGPRSADARVLAAALTLSNRIQGVPRACMRK